MVMLKIRRQRGRHEETPPEPSVTVRQAERHRQAQAWHRRKETGEWCNPEHEDMFRALWRELCGWREYVKRQQRGW